MTQQYERAFGKMQAAMADVMELNPSRGGDIIKAATEVVFPSVLAKSKTKTAEETKEAEAAASREKWQEELVQIAKKTTTPEKAGGQKGRRTTSLNLKDVPATDSKTSPPGSATKRKLIYEILYSSEEEREGEGEEEGEEEGGEEDVAKPKTKKKKTAFLAAETGQPSTAKVTNVKAARAKQGTKRCVRRAGK